MKKRVIKRLCIIALCLILVGGLAVAGINLGMILSTRDRITSPEDTFEDIDCILVLGCQVHSDGTPSHMLQDRLQYGVNTYFSGDDCPKILMSGDHGQEGYDEVNVMKQYAIAKGVPSEDIFMDHAGFSTYESIYRAKEIFGAKRIVIVTQEYHLYRALYVADALGLEAWGVAANPREYAGQFSRDCREILARVKDFGMGILKPQPTYLGEAIDISGSGDITNDRQVS